MQDFDVIVIGAGPGGYVAAIKAAQLGKNVACIDTSNFLGGTCLNQGCIPSKTLLNSSYKYYETLHKLEEHGISCTSVEFSLSKMMERKDTIVSTLGKGIEGLFKKNKVALFKGRGSFISSNEIKITQKQNDIESSIRGKNIIIATGSQPISLPNIAIDEKFIFSSTGALALPSVPGEMIILGGGVIGLEMGSIWSRLGAKVTIIEYAEKIMGNSDIEIAREAQKILEKQGINFLLKTKAISASINDNVVSLNIEINGNIETKKADVILVAVGRKAYVDGLALENVGIVLDKYGKIPVDSSFKTSRENIFAIGDVISGPMLAHKASEEGIAVAEIIAGQHGHVNYSAIPSVIYTHPEIASVGATEEQLKAQGIEYNIGKFPFVANSRARTTAETEGFVKIIACKKTDEVLGAHIIGPCAGELITEISLGIEFKAASEDIARTSHSHPGFSEAVKEAALAAFSKPIHI